MLGRRPMTADEKREFDDIFECTAQAQGLAPEHLADRCSYCMEITISLPKNWPTYQKLSLIEKQALYSSFWTLLTANCKELLNSKYCLEYDDPNFPHLHGYISYKAPPAIEEHLSGHLRDFAKIIYLNLPKRYWNHFLTSKYDGQLARLKSHAVVINFKDEPENGWMQYMYKKTQ